MRDRRPSHLLRRVPLLSAPRTSSSPGGTATRHPSGRDTTARRCVLNLKNACLSPPL
ncbi:hypothetical protein B0H12DRAFT_1160843 [Mycena haematopus]|nr:hypothetical protein B0H12DRAFT_1160843 [Mycena haematopus]